jgi:hypothetical protein
MLRFKTSHLFLALGLIAPVWASAANLCIKVNGGFGNGGISFVGKGFALPAAGLCKPWAGWAKTGTSVIFTSTGTACLSGDGKVLTAEIFSTDPEFLGTGGNFIVNHIQLCPGGATGCPFGGGTADGDFFSGAAATQSCTTKLLSLPALHD